MLPPGLSFNAISEKAWAACQAGGDRRSYWDWRDMMTPNDAGYFPFTPATTLLYGLREALDCWQKRLTGFCTSCTPRIRDPRRR